MSDPQTDGGFSRFGSFLTFVVILGLIGLGVYVFLARSASTPPGTGKNTAPDATPGANPTGAPVALAEHVPPTLPAAATYAATDGVLVIDISEYAGYAGLIAANGGLQPNPQSLFTTKFGLKIKLDLGEGDRWGELQSGRFVASALTADSLPVLGRPFRAVTPLLLGFSRGADALVARAGVRSINDLRGKSVAVAPFNESEFLVRYLAQEAGIPVQSLASTDAAPDATSIGLVYAEDAFKAGDLFLAALGKPTSPLAACLTWSPKTEAVVAASAGKTHVLFSNKNLLLVADLLVINEGFAYANADAVQGLVQGILLGNRLVRDRDPAALAAVAAGFGWTPAKTDEQLARVHLANLPENRAFFAGTIDAAGSFSGIYQASVLAYGRILRDPPDAERFAYGKALAALDASGAFAGERAAIAPLRSAGAKSLLEGDPILAKDIRFQFQPNDAVLDLSKPENLQWLEQVRTYLNVSPGSQVQLRGHVDGSQIAKFRAEGGTALVQKMALQAMDLSKRRADEIRTLLVNRLKVDPARIETKGMGWESQIPGGSDANRRVEVRWFVLE